LIDHGFYNGLTFCVFNSVMTYLAFLLFKRTNETEIYFGTGLLLIHIWFGRFLFIIFVWPN